MLPLALVTRIAGLVRCKAGLYVYALQHIAKEQDRCARPDLCRG